MCIKRGFTVCFIPFCFTSIYFCNLPEISTFQPFILPYAVSSCDAFTVIIFTEVKIMVKRQTLSLQIFLYYNCIYDMQLEIGKGMDISNIQIRLVFHFSSSTLPASVKPAIIRPFQFQTSIYYCTWYYVKDILKHEIWT